MNKVSAGIFVPLIFLLGCNFLPKSYIIPQNGMYPNYPANTQVWATRNPYKSISDIRYGDVIVFVREQNNERYNYVWRVVALPRDTISTTNSEVWLNGIKLEHQFIREEKDFTIFKEMHRDSEYLIAYKKADSVKEETSSKTVVPSDAVFVLGDNRDDALDSRYLGTVTFASIIGKIK